MQILKNCLLSSIYSEDATVELDTEVANGRTNIVPEITEEEAFREMLKKRKQAEAAALKQAKRVKKRGNDQIKVSNRTLRANAVLGNGCGRGTRGRGRGRGHDSAK